MRNLSVLLFFLAASLYLTWPMVQNIDHAFLSEKQKSDANQYIWNSYILGSNMQDGKALFETEALIIPENINLAMHTYTPLMGVFSLMFENKVLGNNLFLLLHFF